MKRLNKITSAEGDDSKLVIAIDDLKDDFDFIVSGLEKLDRSGAEDSNNGLVIAERLQSVFQDVISEIGDSL